MLIAEAVGRQPFPGACSLGYCCAIHVVLYTRSRRLPSLCVTFFLSLSLFGICLCAIMAWFYLCFFALLSRALAQSNDSLISCYGFGDWEYGNNTACPGSNACCGSGAACISNRLCHNPEDGSETFVRAPCQDPDFGFESCAKICRTG
jgi:hypothetical protein